MFRIGADCDIRIDGMWCRVRITDIFIDEEYLLWICGLDLEKKPRRLRLRDIDELWARVRYPEPEDDPEAWTAGPQ
jgi:hypothetical protein